MEDQVKRAVESKKVSGKFVLDEKGYEQFIPSDDELQAINRWLAEETSAAEDEYRPIYEEAAEDIQTYKATKSADLIDGKEAILPAPLARIAVDQYVAWIYNTIMRPTPIVSFQPYFKDSYDVVTPPPPDMAAQMAGMGQGVVIPKSAEDVSWALEQGYDFKLREGVDFGPKLLEAIKDATIVSRGYMKVCRERVEQPILTPKKNGAIIDFTKKEETYSQAGDSVHWYSIPVFNILKRIHGDDIDRAEWFQERTPCSAEEFRGRALSGDFPLLSDEEVDTLARSIVDTKPDAQKTVETQTQNKFSPTPKNMIDLRLVWFYRTVRYEETVTETAVELDPLTGMEVEIPVEKKVARVKRVSFMGDYHATAQKLCNLYRNPYDHQLRPYAVCYQIKDAHSDSGSSTTSVSKWFQKVATHLTQAEIKNAFHANNLSYWYDPDSPNASSVFSSGGTFQFRPGMGIGAKFGEEWGVVRAGEAPPSLVGLLTLVGGWAREVQNMSTLESGDSMPSRTPSSSISQVLQQGMQQPLMFLRQINDFVRRLVMLDMETRRQYEPLGEVIPTRDPETKQLVNVPFRFPLGEVAKNFRIGLTAADEALAKEHEPEQLIMLLDRWQMFAQFVATMAGPMQQMTPAQRDLMNRVISGGQTLFDRIVTLTRTDREKFDLTPAIDALNQEIDAAMMQMQQEQANAEAQGGSGGPVPAAASQPDQSGLGGIPPEPGNATGFGEAAPTGDPGAGEVLQ